MNQPENTHDTIFNPIIAPNIGNYHLFLHFILLNLDFHLKDILKHVSMSSSNIKEELKVNF